MDHTIDLNVKVLEAHFFAVSERKFGSITPAFKSNNFIFFCLTHITF